MFWLVTLSFRTWESDDTMALVFLFCIPLCSIFFCILSFLSWLISLVQEESKLGFFKMANSPSPRFPSSSMMERVSFPAVREERELRKSSLGCKTSCCCLHGSVWEKRLRRGNGSNFQTAESHRKSGSMKMLIKNCCCNKLPLPSPFHNRISSSSFWEIYGVRTGISRFSSFSPPPTYWVTQIPHFGVSK